MWRVDQAAAYFASSEWVVVNAFSSLAPDVSYHALLPGRFGVLPFSSSHVFPGIQHQIGGLLPDGGRVFGGEGHLLRVHRERFASVSVRPNGRNWSSPRLVNRRALSTLASSSAEPVSGTKREVFRPRLSATERLA